MIPDERIVQLLERYDFLQHQLADPAALGSGKFVEVSKEYADLSPVVQGAEALKALREEITDLEEMATDTEGDAEMRGMAAEELGEAKKRIPDLERDLSLLLLPKDAADERSAILEIRAGTGGDEAGCVDPAVENAVEIASGSVGPRAANHVVSRTSSRIFRRWLRFRASRRTTAPGR